MTQSWLQWLHNTGERLQTTDGKTVEVWEFCRQNDQAVLSTWASHFRNHYCLDTEIDNYRRGYNYSRSEYLVKIKFPDERTAPGPSIRAGDFGEVLVADYLEYILGFWVPRTRYSDKTVRNESTKGCDIIGFKFLRDEKYSKDDMLAIFESKTQFSGHSANSRLQDAVIGSAKDNIRKAESLNAIKQRLFIRQLHEDAEKVERFQNIEDRPYKETFGAVALFSTNVYDAQTISATTVACHPKPNDLKLLVIHGVDFMALVHELYRRAANEA